jgi:beta-RFAP synthase
MGFIDMSGALGRHFGSIGVALNEISTRLMVQAADSLTITGQGVQRAERCTQQLCAALGVSDRLAIHIETVIPEHVGLGSGTQMALAIGSALNAFYDLDLSVREIARLTDRGARSGIGIGIFEQGGLVVDGGRGEHTVTPPMIVHMDVPEQWRFLLVFDRRGQGLHGKQEVSAFKALPPFPQEEAARLCYLLLMQALPAVAEQDIERFGDVITQMQASVGGHFAAVQGGVFTSLNVSEAMRWLQRQGAVAIGQTSWGPTGFCAIDGPERAEQLLQGLKQQFKDNQQLEFRVVSARNSRANVLVS